ncbi:MAG: HMA2 domain-containing protein [Thermodesulfobacteriota bacterium]
MSHYIHTVPGRIRVKNKIFKYNPRNCEMARETLQHLPGVHEIKTNPSTGSVVIRYDGSTIQADRLLLALEEKRLIQNSSLSSSKDSYVENIVADTGAKMGKAMIGWAVGKALEANGLSLLAALI